MDVNGTNRGDRETRDSTTTRHMTFIGRRRWGPFGDKVPLEQKFRRINRRKEVGLYRPGTGRMSGKMSGVPKLMERVIRFEGPSRRRRINISNLNDPRDVDRILVYIMYLI